jgi:RND family efflux transporter MFP subunit
MKKIILGLVLACGVYANDIYATFHVEAIQSAKLAFVTGGIVKDVNVDIGDKVKKGQILASLQNDDIKAMKEVAKTTLKYAKKDFQRQLKVKNLIDEAKFDAVSFKYENAKNQLIYQEALLAKTYLKAPFDGVIYYKDIVSGDAVTGMNPKTVFKLQSISKRKLIISYDQKHRKSVKVGDVFKYKIDGDEKLYKGLISKIYPSADAKSRKIQAQVIAEDIMPNLFGDGYITIK